VLFSVRFWLSYLFWSPQMKFLFERSNRMTSVEKIWIRMNFWTTFQYFLREGSIFTFLRQQKVMRSFPKTGKERSATKRRNWNKMTKSYFFENVITISLERHHTNALDFLFFSHEIIAGFESGHPADNIVLLYICSTLFPVIFLCL
jgi:hypothetical protein